MTDAIREKWDNRYRDADTAPTACQVLTENKHLLPCSGTALDFACGRGGNARLLALHGLQTQAWDLSPVAIGELNQFANQKNLPLVAQVKDVEATPIPKEQFDVIVVSYFLDRDLWPGLIAALKPEGLLFYETFVVDKVNARGPTSREYLLAANELLHLSTGMHVLSFRDEGQVGDTTQGCRDIAMLVAQKRE